MNGGPTPCAKCRMWVDEDEWVWVQCEESHRKFGIRQNYLGFANVDWVRGMGKALRWLGVALAVNFVLMLLMLPVWFVVAASNRGWGFLYGMECMKIAAGLGLVKTLKDVCTREPDVVPGGSFEWRWQTWAFAMGCMFLLTDVLKMNVPPAYEGVRIALGVFSGLAYFLCLASAAKVVIYLTTRCEEKKIHDLGRDTVRGLRFVVWVTAGLVVLGVVSLAFEVAQMPLVCVVVVLGVPLVMIADCICVYRLAQASWVLGGHVRGLAGQGDPGDLG